MGRWGLLAVCGFILLAGTGADGPTDKDDRIEITAKYVRVEPIELADHADQFVGKSVEVRDRFARMARSSDVPREVERLGITSRTHAAFLTHAVTGSNMLCFVPQADKEAATVLEGLVAESPITMAGDVVRRVGNTTIFLVNRLWRGHVSPPEVEKYRLVVTVKAPDGVEEKRYTIPELNKYYIIYFVGTDGRPVRFHLKAELR